MFIKLDGERSLEEKFTNFITEKDIIFELSASNTSAQNDYIERKKDILLAKERAMRIQADLSVYLWSWIVQIVEYFMNRTLMKKHEWKTFFEAVTERKFNLTHLIQFEAKAYFIDKHILKKKNMRFRAHRNFLIEYDSINIFNIWISSLHKVIRTCDVIFDENNFYKFSQIDLIQVINELFLISDDTLNIFKSQFIKIEELSNISNEKDLTLMPIDIIRTDETDENDKEDSFIKTLETDEDEVNKNDQR